MAVEPETVAEIGVNVPEGCQLVSKEIEGSLSGVTTNGAKV